MSITVTHLRQAEIGLRRGVDMVETMPATRRKESDGTVVLGWGFQVCVCVCVCVKETKGGTCFKGNIP